MGEEAFKKLKEYLPILPLYLATGATYQFIKILTVSGRFGLSFFNRGQVVNDSAIITSFGLVLLFTHWLFASLNIAFSFTKKIAPFLKLLNKKRFKRGLLLVLSLGILYLFYDYTFSAVVCLFLGFASGSGTREGSKYKLENNEDGEFKKSNGENLYYLIYHTIYIIFSIAVLSIPAPMYVHKEVNNCKAEKVNYINGTYIFTDSGIERLQDNFIFSVQNNNICKK